jgi:hypothetical protein
MTHQASFGISEISILDFLSNNLRPDHGMRK